MDIDVTDVNSEGSSSSQDEYSFLDDSGNLASDAGSTASSKPTGSAKLKGDVKEKSSNSSEDQEQVGLTGEDTAEESAAKSKDKVDETKKVDPKPQENRRVRQLVAKANEERTARQNVEFELERYKTAFKILNEQHESKLAEHKALAEKFGVTFTKEQIENEKFKMAQRIEQENAQMTKTWTEKVKAAQSEAKVQALTQQLVDSVEDALAAYPNTVNKLELAMAFKEQYLKNPKVKAVDIAKQLHEQKRKAFETELAGTMKTLKNAPKPISQNGSTSRRQIKTDEDLIAELDEALGIDWNRR